MNDLSARQRELYEYLCAAVDQSGVVPTYREIGKALGINSTNGVSEHVKALIRKGYLEQMGGPGAPRALRILGRDTSQVEDELTVGVPILGRIAAGEPILAQESYETSVRVDASLLPSGGAIFGLIVQGESMIDDGIHPGDTLFVRQGQTARNGQIAVVMVEGEATVKRVYREGNGMLRLQPANASMEPIFVSERSGDVQVVGLVVGLYRRISI